MTAVPVVQKPMDQFLYDRTSVMKELRRSSPIILHLLLQVVKQNSLFFFYLRILSRIFTIKTTVGDWRGGPISLYLYYYFHLLHRHLGIATGSLLRRAHLWAQLVVVLEPGTCRFLTQVAKHEAICTLQHSLFLHLQWQLLMLGECLKLV